MSPRQLQEIIAEACAQGAEPLDEFVRRATGVDEDAGSAAAFALQIIRDVPRLLELVHEQAEIRGVGLLVEPLVQYAERYFLEPVDHAPEIAYGITGLLDDAYLALRLVGLVQEVVPLTRVDVEGRLEFLRRLLGPELVAALDAEAGRAVLEMATTVGALRERIAPLDSAPPAAE